MSDFIKCVCCGWCFKDFDGSKYCNLFNEFLDYSYITGCTKSRIDQEEKKIFSSYSSADNTLFSSVDFDDILPF